MSWYYGYFIDSNSSFIWLFSKNFVKEKVWVNVKN